MPENCDCGLNMPNHLRYCPACARDRGFPNVRAAATEEEVAALLARFEVAERDAQSRGCFQQLQRFGAAVGGSKAIVCRNLERALAFVSSDNALYNSFYQQVQSEGRIPEDNGWDQARVAVDATLFPYYQEKIIFGMLSLDNRVSSYYGGYAIVLKESMIGHRASVFECNSVTFFRDRPDVRVGGEPPKGYRAKWVMRDRFAMAKYHSEIASSTSDEMFPRILFQDAANSVQDDFIEVHIYGPVHRQAVERIVGPDSEDESDQAFLRSMRKKLKEIGAPLDLFATETK